MTEVKGHICHARVRSTGGNHNCDDQCGLYSKKHPCPMWLPPVTFGKDVCMFCIKNPLSCGSEPLRIKGGRRPIACYNFTLTEVLKHKGTVKLLNKDFNLTVITDIELANIMQDLCSTYDMCRTEISTATLEVWACIVRVAKEIAGRP